MRTIIGTITVSCLLLLAVGCKRDYKCTCTLDLDSTGQTIVYWLLDMSHGEAEDSCAAADSRYKLIDSDAGCVLE